MTRRLQNAFFVVAPGPLDHAGLIGRSLLQLMRGAIALGLCREAGVATGSLLRMPSAGADAGALPLVQVALLAIALTAVGALLGFARERQFAISLQRLHVRLFDALTRMPMTYHQAQNAAGLQTEFERSATLVTRFVTDTLPRVPAAVLVLVMTSTLLLQIDGPLTLALTTGLTAILAGAWVCARAGRRMATDAQRSHGATLANLGDLLTNIASVKAFGAGGWRTRVFESLSQRSLAASLKNTLYASTVSPALFAGVIVIALGIVAANINGYLGTPLTAEHVVILTGYAWIMAAQMTALGQSLSTWHQLKPALDTLDPLLGCELAEQPGDTAAASPARSRPVAPGPVSIELRNIQFGFSAHTALFSDVNLRVAPGTMVAISGPNGAGKSTLAALLLGFFRPTAGTVLIDGRALAADDRGGPRERIGWAPQIPQILLASLAENVALGRASEDPDRLMSVLQLTGCEHLIAALPEGLDTPLGGGAAILSGGQQQRVCLARALYEQPGALILDEALSMLPPEDETGILERIRTDSVRRPTLLCMTHRTHVIQMADSHWSLDGGTLRCLRSQTP